MPTTFSLAKRSSSISINPIVPQGRHKHPDKQLRYVYQLTADNFATADESHQRKQNQTGLAYAVNEQNYRWLVVLKIGLLLL